MRKHRKVLLIVVTIVALYLGNASWRVSSMETEYVLISHRGVHQNYIREGIENDACSAELIYPPAHNLLENTLPSMEAAFAAGADIVEIDVHPTTDGHFAVLHDWTVDCRTDGSGVTRSHDLEYLKSLDVGFGYTADGGKTFPLRGSGVGMLPSLEDVFASDPDGKFLINFKSRNPREAEMLAELLSKHPKWEHLVWGVYGGEEPTQRAVDLLDIDLAHWSHQSVTDCLFRYIAYGWSGVMPAGCRHTTVMVPANVAPWLWGWPNLFQKRFEEANSRVILVGPYRVSDPSVTGIDSVEELAMIPESFSGYVWTNRIEEIGPLARRK